MASVNQVTYTGVAGPGTTLTSRVFSNVVGLHFDYVENTIIIEYGGTINTQRIVVSLTPVTTVTYTISGGNATVTIS